MALIEQRRHMGDASIVSTTDSRERFVGRIGDGEWADQLLAEGGEPLGRMLQYLGAYAITSDTKDGRKQAREVLYRLGHDPDYAAAYSARVWNDALAEQKQWEAGHRDSKTGLLDKPTFMQRVVWAMQAREHDLRKGVVRPEDSAIAVAVLDLNHFKIVNDILGYEGADRILKEVAEFLTRNMRDGDKSCARLGGDEFAVLLTMQRRTFIIPDAERPPNSSEPGIWQKLLTESTRGLPIDADMSTVAIRILSGVAEFLNAKLGGLGAAGGVDGLGASMGIAVEKLGAAPAASGETPKEQNLRLNQRTEELLEGAAGVMKLTKRAMEYGYWKSLPWRRRTLYRLGALLTDLSGVQLTDSRFFRRPWRYKSPPRLEEWRHAILIE